MWIGGVTGGLAAVACQVVPAKNTVVTHDTIRQLELESVGARANKLRTRSRPVISMSPGAIQVVVLLPWLLGVRPLQLVGRVGKAGLGLLIHGAHSKADTALVVGCDDDLQAGTDPGDQVSASTHHQAFGHMLERRRGWG